MSVSEAVAGAAGAVALVSGLALAPLGRWRVRSAALFAAACSFWGAAQLSGIVSAPGSPEPWFVLSAGAASAAAFVVSGTVRFWPHGQVGPGEVRRVCAAAMLAIAASMLLYVTLGVPGRGLIGGVWVLVISLHVLVFALVSEHLVRFPGAWLTVMAGGALFALGSDAALVLLSGAAAQVLFAVLGLVGWAGLVLGAVMSAAPPAEPVSPDAGAAGPGAIELLSYEPAIETASAEAATLTGSTRPGAVTTIALAVLAAASLLIVMADRITPAYLVMLFGLVACFAGHEVAGDVQQGRMVRRLDDLASTDPLTRLGNRRALAAALETAGTGTGPMSLLTIDLDNFKMINTLLGHAAGDRLLSAVARAVAGQCEPLGAQAFRLGGDEFAVLVRDSPSRAVVLADRLIDRIGTAAASIPGVSRVDVSGSIGIAHRDGAADVDAWQQLSRSGDAMRAAKAAGRAQARVYGGSVARHQNRHDAVERRLRRAVANGEVELAFQPIITLPEMRMVGMESLARWTDEELGAVSPAEFVAVAEDCGLITELGLQLTRRSMEVSVRTGAHAAGLIGGVNVSPTQLRSPQFVRQMGELLDELGVEPRQFALEITESVRIEEDDPARTAIARLSDLGMPIAIDDFGTGYASLTLISSLPVKIVKLDRSITQRLDDPRWLAIARSVSDMARSLGIDVVAEGIETAQHLEAIRRLDVGFGQGWLFQRAVDEEQFARFVDDPALVLQHLPADLRRPYSAHAH